MLSTIPVLLFQNGCHEFHFSKAKLPQNVLCHEVCLCLFIYVAFTVAFHSPSSISNELHSTVINKLSCSAPTITTFPTFSIYSRKPFNFSGSDGSTDWKVFSSITLSTFCRVGRPTVTSALRLLDAQQKKTTCRPLKFFGTRS